MRLLTDGLWLPEGPIALADGSLLVVEVLGGRLTRITPDGVRSTVAEVGGGPNGAAIGPDGRCYICNNGGFDFIQLESGERLPREAAIETQPGSIQVVDLKTGAFETIYRHCDATPFWGPNDIVFDREGGFWFTDFGRDRGRSRMRGALYYAMPDGQAIREVISPIDAPNGIGLSLDESTLYVATTYEAHLLAFRLQAPGVVNMTAGSMPHGATIIGRAGPGQYLDSLAVDSIGQICVASPGGGAILVFPPNGGAPTAIETGDFLTTNICFGGPDLKTAYVTLGSKGCVTMIDWPVPGRPLAF